MTSYVRGRSKQRRKCCSSPSLTLFLAADTNVKIRETFAGARNTDGYKKPFVAEIKTRDRRSTRMKRMKRMKPKLITVRWEGNDSARYDRVVQQIATRHVFAEDMANTEVGETVRIKWGGATWTAVVIQLPDDTEERPAKATTKHSADDTDKNSAAKRQKSECPHRKGGIRPSICFALTAGMLEDCHISLCTCTC